MFDNHVFVEMFDNLQVSESSVAEQGPFFKYSLVGLPKWRIRQRGHDPSPSGGKKFGAMGHLFLVSTGLLLYTRWPMMERQDNAVLILLLSFIASPFCDTGLWWWWSCVKYHAHWLFDAILRAWLSRKSRCSLPTDNATYPQTEPLHALLLHKMASLSFLYIAC